MSEIIATKSILDIITDQVSELAYLNIKPSVLVLGTMSHYNLHKELNSMPRNADTTILNVLNIHSYSLDVVVSKDMHRILVLGNTKDY